MIPTHAENAKDMVVSIKQITNNKSVEKGDPITYKDKILWEDGRNDPNGNITYNANSDIYLFNTTTGMETQITGSEYPEGPGSLWENNLIYYNGSPYYADPVLTYYNLLTKEKKNLTTKSAGTAVIWRNDVAYYRFDWINKKEDANIYLFNISTDQEIPICTAQGDQLFPLMWGNFIVWQDNRNNNSDVFGYDINLNKEFVIAIGPGPQSPDSIWEDVLLYYNNGSFVLYNLTTKSIIQKIPHGIYVNRIWGDFLIGNYFNNGTVTIYRISTNTSYIENIQGPTNGIISSFYYDRAVYAAGSSAGNFRNEIYLLEFKIPGIFPPGNGHDGNRTDDGEKKKIIIISVSAISLSISAFIVSVIVMRRNHLMLNHRMKREKRKHNRKTDRIK